MVHIRAKTYVLLEHIEGFSLYLAQYSVNNLDTSIYLLLFQIWDIQDQCCLFTADSQASGIHGDISACSYSSAVKSFYFAADCIAVLSMKIRLVVKPPCFIHHRIQCTVKILKNKISQGCWFVKFK